MGKVLINEETLSSLGDVIRDKKGEEKYLRRHWFNKTITNEDIVSDNTVLIEVPSDISDISNINIKLNCRTLNNSPTSSFQMKIGYRKKGNTGAIYVYHSMFVSSGDKVYKVELSDSDKTFFSDDTYNFYFGYYSTSYVLYPDDVIEIWDDTIIGKNPETTYTPSEMVEEIADMAVLRDEDLTFGGNEQYYCFSGNGWNKIFEKCGDKIKTNNISIPSYMFYNNQTVEKIPFEINLEPISSSTSGHDMNYIFSGCYKLKEPPKINNAKPKTLSRLFYECRSLISIPEDWVSDWTWSFFHSQLAGSSSSIFYHCYNLRRIPDNFLSNLWLNGQTSATGNVSYQCFSGCYCLDEIKNFPLPKATISSGSTLFNAFVDNCSRLKKLTFETVDKEAQTATFKGATLDMSNYVGYVVSGNIGFGEIKNHIGEENRITDAESYERLKDNPDSWTTMVEYSRYNHDSAVNTINSLPDTSAYGTNTIKFKGASGSLTDGGAINTLTDAEIAVATAKGWTVSFV